MDRRTWQVHRVQRVTKSRTRLKQLSTTGGPGGRGESRTPQSCRINPGSILGGVLKEDQGRVRLGLVGDKEGVQF